MRIKAKSLFNIGDVVRIKGADTRFVIGGIMVEVCPGGTQIHYSGIVLEVGIGIRDRYAAQKDHRLNEIFLETIPPAPPVEKGKDVKGPGYPLSAGMKIRGFKHGKV
jgi:hypothetical protein